MAWSKEWPSYTGKEIAIEQAKQSLVSWPNQAKVNDELIRELNNKVPTHDPYTNPNAHIYFQCDCGAVLDPSTKSFASLTTAASNAGWKIRFGHEHYQAYCVKCGEGMD